MNRHPPTIPQAPKNKTETHPIAWTKTSGWDFPIEPVIINMPIATNARAPAISSSVCHGDCLISIVRVVSIMALPTSFRDLCA
jgi:hypothetical protein